jgi:hypothetical protein
MCSLTPASCARPRCASGNDELINDLLGPPYEIRPNPYYPNGADRELWRKIDVIAAEDDERFMRRPATER